MPQKQKVDPTLGNSLRNSRGNLKKERFQKKGAPSTLDELEETLTPEPTVTQSVLEESSVQEFMARAQLADLRFVAERQTAHMVIEPSTVITRNAPVPRHADDAMIRKHAHRLKIPRRPQNDQWSNADELHAAERTMFLNWRRDLAELEEIDNLVVTPFERNLEMWRQLWRVLERSDVVAQIVDARHPLLFYNVDLQTYVNHMDGNKHHVLILNKAELLSHQQRATWRDYFEANKVHVIFWSAIIEERTESEPSSDGSTEWEHTKSSDKPVVDAYEQPAVCTVTQLIDQLKYMGRLANPDKHPITAGMVGYPNVGKSSTINRLLGRKKVAVSATPGKTLHFQTLVVDNELTLCDCPGLVMPSLASSAAEMLLYGVLPIAQLRDYNYSIGVLCSRVSRKQLEHTFGIMLPSPAAHEQQDRPPTPTELLTCVAFVRGFMATKGLPDMSRAARVVLQTVVSGKLVCSIPPPNVDAEEYNTMALDRSNKRIQSSAPATLLQQLTNRRLLPSANVRTAELDSAFFASEHNQAHVKGTKQGSGSTKRHFNKHKKEKLRRIYSDMDA